jgi:DNA-binding CsgD family transcriptional regulator
MVTTHIARAAKLRAQLALEEKQIAIEMRSELRALPGKFGFETPAELFQAMLESKRAAGGAPLHKKGKEKGGFSGPLPAKRKKWTPLPDKVHSKIHALIAEGLNPYQVSKKVGLHPSTVAYAVKHPRTIITAVSKKRRRTTITRALDRAIAKGVKKSGSMAGTAKALGISSQAVQYSLTRQKIPHPARHEIRGTNPITPEEKNRVGILVAQGKTMKQMAKELGRSVSVIWKIKKELGLIQKPRLH